MKNKIHKKKLNDKKYSKSHGQLYSELLNHAKSYLQRSHSPYSHVKVACAVLTNSDKIYGGANIENASYGATICAERVAITKAISEGETKIKAILVVTNQNKIWPPCGICRQVISEFATGSMVVYCSDLKDNYIKIKFSKLLPSAFSPDYLKK